MTHNITTLRSTVRLASFATYEGSGQSDYYGSMQCRNAVLYIAATPRNMKLQRRESNTMIEHKADFQIAGLWFIRRSRGSLPRITINGYLLSVDERPDVYLHTGIHCFILRLRLNDVQFATVPPSERTVRKVEGTFEFTKAANSNVHRHKVVSALNQSTLNANANKCAKSGGESTFTPKAIKVRF